MRIAYCGNRKNLASDGLSYNTENHITKTLEDLGHTVYFYQENELMPNWSKTMPKGIDFFMYTRTWGKVTSEDLKNIEAQDIPTVSFHLDLYSNIARNGGLGTDSFWQTQYVFSPEGSTEAKQVFKSLGINQYYLPAGVFDQECYIAPSDTEYKHDIVFVGGGVEYAHPEWQYRGKLVTWLQQTYGTRFAKFGYPNKSMRGQELNKLYSNSKIVIGDSLCKGFMDSYYYSDRAFEVTGRGGFLIHPYIAGITDHFVDRKEAVFYAFDNFRQLKNLIDYYLEHDTEREAIRLAGHERTARTNTYKQRMIEMLAVLKSEDAI